MAAAHLRFYLGVVAASLLSMFGSLTALAVGPALVKGDLPVVIVSDSMRPSIARGDVVVGTPYDGKSQVRADSVILFRNSPETSLITHRVVGMRADGSYQTKGDANPVADSTPVHAADIAARATMVVPLVGLPAVWIRAGEWGKLALAAVVLAVLALLARFGVLDRYSPWRLAQQQSFEHDDVRPDPRDRPPGEAGDELDQQLDATPPARTPPATEPSSALRPVVPALFAESARASAARKRGILPSLRHLPVLLVVVLLLVPSAASALSDTTVNATNTWAAAASFGLSRYLKTDGAGNRTSVAVLPLSETVPTLTTLPNYDTNRDSEPGLMIIKGGSGAGETDNSKQQTWSQLLASSTTLSGDGTLTFWSAIKGFGTNKPGEVAAYLLDCNSTGGSCVTIDSATLNVANWSGGSGTWVSRTISFGAISYVIAANRTLRLKIIVGANSGDDMWFAYDTTVYPTQLKVI